MATTTTTNTIVRYIDGSTAPYNRRKLRDSIWAVQPVSADYLVDGAPAASPADLAAVLMKVERGLPSGDITYEELLHDVAKAMNSLVFKHGPHMSDWAGHIITRFLANSMPKTMHEVGVRLCSVRDKTGKVCPLICERLSDAYTKHSDFLDGLRTKYGPMCVSGFDYMAIKTFMGKYGLSGPDGRPLESPIEHYIRIAVGLNGDDLASVETSVAMQSMKHYTHATPTKFNTGTLREQLSSCFLIDMFDDSIRGIFLTLWLCAEISKNAGGIGLAINILRARDAYIRGTSGVSHGKFEFSKIYDSSAHCVDQGGKRKGAWVVWNTFSDKDIEEVLKARLNMGDDMSKRFGDLFTGVWAEDVVMARIENAVNLKRAEDIFHATEAAEAELSEATRHVQEAFRDAHRATKEAAQSVVTMTHEMPLPETLQQLTVTNSASPLDYARETKKPARTMLTFVHEHVAVVLDLAEEAARARAELSKAVKVQKMLVEKVVELHSKVVSREELERLRTLPTDVSLFCPDENRHMRYLHGTEYTTAYAEFEARAEFCEAADAALQAKTGDKDAVDYSIEGRVTRTVVPALHLWDLMHKSQQEAGLPYIMFKDHVNATSMYSEHAIVQSSNLCCEITEPAGVADGVRKFIEACQSRGVITSEDIDHYETTLADEFSAPLPSNFHDMTLKQQVDTMRDNERETAVCNLGSIGLPAHLKLISSSDDTEDDTAQCKYTLDLHSIHETAAFLVQQLDIVIDRNYYPEEMPQSGSSTLRSNMRHRPVAIGFSGLANVLQKLRIPFDSPEAVDLSGRIMQAIDHGSLVGSCERAKTHGPFPTWEGSPAHSGLFHFELVQRHWVESGRAAVWFSLSESDRVVPTNLAYAPPTVNLEWDYESYRGVPVRNRVRTALMPTATTAQMLGFSESFDPMTANVTVRRVLSGTFTRVNSDLFELMASRGLWTPTNRNNLRRDRSSVANIEGLTDHEKAVFKTAWEMDMVPQMQAYRARQPFVCQAQSFNVFRPNPTDDELTDIHLWMWRGGCPNGSYYVRRKPALEAQQVTLENEDNMSLSVAQERLDTFLINLFSAVDEDDDEAGEEEKQEVVEEVVEEEEKQEVVEEEQNTDDDVVDYGVCELGPGGADCEACQ